MLQDWVSFFLFFHSFYMPSASVLRTCIFMYILSIIYMRYTHTYVHICVSVFILYLCCVVLVCGVSWSEYFTCGYHVTETV